MGTTYLYSDDVYRECLSRIDKLRPDSTPEWGSMSPAQMLAHCAEIQEVSNGKALTGTPWFIKPFKGFIRKMVLNDQPYSKGIRTHPQYQMDDEKDFETEKERLKRSIETFVNDVKQEKEVPAHPILGTMTHEERGWGMYKHLDHHLRQFGV